MDKSMYNKIIKDVLGITFENVYMGNGDVNSPQGTVYKTVIELTIERRKLENMLDKKLDGNEITEEQYDNAYLAIAALYDIYKGQLTSRENSNSINTMSQTSGKNVDETVNGIKIEPFEKYRKSFEEKYHYDEMSDDEKERFDYQIERTYIEMLIREGIEVESIKRIGGLYEVDRILSEIFEKEMPEIIEGGHRIR